MLSGRGFEATTSTLKSLLARATAQEPGQRRRRKKKRAAAVNVAATPGHAKSGPTGITTNPKKKHPQIQAETQTGRKSSALRNARITGGESDTVD